MMKVLYFLILVSLPATIMAQQNWTITLNNKSILKTKGENEAKNIARIKLADLKDGAKFEFSVKPIKDWTTTVMITDSVENDLGISPDGYTKKNSPGLVYFKLDPAKLKELLAKHRRIKIYSLTIPSDPDKAAAVRIRRVHVCTITVKQ